MQPSFSFEAKGSLVTAKHVYNTYDEWVCLVDLGNEFCVCSYVSGCEEWISGRYFDSKDEAMSSYDLVSTR